MNWLADHTLSILIFLPLAGSAAIAFSPRAAVQRIRVLALAGGARDFRPGGQNVH